MAGLMTADQPYPDSIGHFLKAVLGEPTLSDGTHVHTFDTSREEMSPCTACGVRWDDCEASQPYADDEDPACCDGCEHEYLPPPPSYTIETVYEQHMREIGLGRTPGH